MKQTICIVTKGRTSRPLSIKYFSQFPDVRLVVFCWNEEEKEIYTKDYGLTEVFIQKYKHGGVSGARQQALEFLREHNLEYGIISDDDIGCVVKVPPMHTVITSPTYKIESIPLVFEEMKTMMINNDLSLLAPTWSGSFARGNYDKIHINSKSLNCFVMYGPEVLSNPKINYDLDQVLLEDVNFTMSVIFDFNLDVGNWSGYEFRNEYNSPGGVFEDRQTKNTLMAERVVSLWTEDIVKFVYQNDSIGKDAMPNGRGIKKKLLSEGRRAGRFTVDRENLTILP